MFSIKPYFSPVNEFWKHSKLLETDAQLDKTK